MSAAVPLLARLDDRLNPILVKEVRQALRGLYFKLTFRFSILAATCVGVVILLSGGGVGAERLGQPFFIAIYACLAAAVHCFVPFLAFVSMSGEWDENTYDLLVISDLKPRQIVFGKLLSAGVVAMLHYSAFGPFLVMAFLLRGVDLYGVLILIGGSTVYSLVLSAVAIAASTFGRARFARVATMAGLAGFLIGATGLSIAAAVGVMEEPELLRATDFVHVVSGLSLGIVFLGAFAVAVATSRLAHAEENRSSELRIVASLLVAAVLLWGAGLAWTMRTPALLLAPLLVLGFVLLLPFTFFVTESETLGRRARRHVSASRLAALFSAPFLPGGGRGLLLFLAVIVIAALCASGAFLLNDDPQMPIAEAARATAVAWSYAVVYLGLSSLVSKGWTSAPKGRIRARLLVLLAFIGPLFVPSVVGFFAESESLLEMKHAGNPFWMIFLAADSGHRGQPASSGWIFAAAAAVLLANMPRMARGVREVLAASAARQERERTGAPAVP